MRKTFTEEITNELNKQLEVLNCAFRFKLVTEEYGERLYNPHIEISLTNNYFVNSFVLNLTNKFYKWLEQLCEDNWNIHLSYNNTRSIIWAKEGWDK